jgi:hypothetical protein
MVGLWLYLLRTKRPDVSRDYDLFFSSIGLLCGGILLFQGWRLDPILLLCQVLLSGTVIFFVGESVWLRSKTHSVLMIGKEDDHSIHLCSLEAMHSNWDKKCDYECNYSHRRLLSMDVGISDWEGLEYTPPIDDWTSFDATDVSVFQGFHSERHRAMLKV